MFIKLAMDRTKVSNILATTRLLAHFSTDNIQVMKSFICEQITGENECEFLCKTLILFGNSMSFESVSSIKNKAMEIADLYNK